MSKREKKQKTKPKRVRTDTFTHMEIDDICSRVTDIINGEHSTYGLNTDYVVKKDVLGKDQHCWCVTSKKSDCVKNLWSSATYRSFYVWWVYDQKKDTEENLEKVDRTGDEKYHHAHRCGVDDCCNPEHIRIISRTENEVDKHYHFFLNQGKREEFMKVFSEELQTRNVW